MADTFKYKAFLSYSHEDKAAAKWIHTRLETFRTPGALVGASGRWGETPARLQPIFRDREELSASSHLGPEIQSALNDSEFLVVLCSPAAAQSVWVNEEIRYFRSRHGAEHVLALIVKGEPGNAVGPGENGCFPPALIAPDAVTGAPTEPIAADARREGDGRRFALLKVKAGLLGVGLNDLVQRDAARRQQRLVIIAALSLCITAVMMVLAAYANIQRIDAISQRAIAETETAATNAALDYLVSLFEVANPATENAKTISALKVLERGREKIDTELTGKPRVQGKLLSTIGQVYMNLGLFDQAEGALSQAIATQGAAPTDKVASQLELAFAYSSRYQLKEAMATLDVAENTLKLGRTDGEHTLEDPDSLQGRLLEVRAVVTYAANDYQSAEKFWSAALDAYGISPNDHTAEQARVHTNLGLLLANRSEFEAAKIQLEAALAINATRFGKEHVNTATALHNLAFTLFSEGKNQAAAEKIKEALRVYNTVLEKDHPALGDAYILAGRIWHADGKLDGSVQFYQQASEVFEAAFGDTHHQIGWAQVYAALVLADAGKFDAAFVALDKARNIYDINYPGDDIYTGDWQVHRAIVLAKSGQTREAAALCAQGLALIKGKMNEKDAYVREMAAACDNLQAN